jgi:hypothetical protein
MFIQIFTTSATTSNSNLENRDLHQRNYIPMIVKIRERGKNLTKIVGGGEEKRRRGLTLAGEW